jgi:hypothetical protein
VRACRWTLIREPIPGVRPNNGRDQAEMDASAAAQLRRSSLHSENWQIFSTCRHSKSAGELNLAAPDWWAGGMAVRGRYGCNNY